MIVFKPRYFWAPVLLTLILFSIPALATPDVHARIQLDTSDDWYPLSESQMKAAAWDAALAEITQTVNIRLLEADDEVAIGSRLNGELSLIGPAEVVKLTLQYEPHDGATLVSTASISIRDMDRQGIFNAFEYVGARAASELADKALIRSQQASVESETRPESESESESESEAEPEGPVADENQIETVTLDDMAIGETFNRAQELKRNGNYQHARQGLLAIRDMARSDQQEWAEMADEELTYGLLVHEVQSLTMTLHEPYMENRERRDIIDLAVNRTREAIAGNLSHAARMRELQNMLSELEMAREALERQGRAQLAAYMRPVELILMEASMIYGHCLDADELKAYGGRIPQGVELVETRGDPDDRLYVYESTSTGGREMLHCQNHGNVTRQEYVPAAE